METVQFDSSRYDLVLDYGFRLFVPILMTSTIALGSRDRICISIEQFHEHHFAITRCPTNLQKRGLCNRGSSEMCHVNGQDKIKYYVGSNIKFSN